MKSIRKYLAEASKPKNLVIYLIYLLLFGAVFTEVLALALILTAALLAALVYYRNLELGFYLGVFSLSFDQIFVPTLLSLKLHMLVFLALALAFAYNSLREKRLPKLPPKSLIIPLGLLLLFSAASILFSTDKIVTARFLGALVYSISVFTITYIFVSDKIRALRTIAALLLSLVVSSAVAIYQFLAFYFNLKFGSSLWTKFNILNPGNFARPKGLFDHTNNFANFCLTSAPILTAFVLWEKKTKVLTLVLLSLFLTAIFLTLSRAAIAGLILATVLIIIMTIRWNKTLFFRKEVILIPILTIFFSSVIFAGFGPLRPGFEPTYKVRDPLPDSSQQTFLTDRIKSSIDPQAVTSVERIQIWKSGIEMLKDNWLTGIGLENFAIRYEEYKLDEAKRSQVSAHNTYLQLLIETGVFGFLSFAWFGLALIFGAIKGTLRSKEVVLKSVLMGSFVAALAYPFESF
jgi:O-antigen ligase